jgi:ABC-2 type transport system permease protein
MKLFLAGLRKLIRRPATYVTFGLLVGLLALILLAVGATAGRPEAGNNGQAGLLLVTFPGAYTFVLSFILGLGGLFGVIYGAAIAGSEWTWGTLKAAVARGESRSRYQLLSFAAIGALLGVGLLLAFAIGVLVAAIGATIAGVSTSGLGDSTALGKLPELFARGWVAMIEQAALGFAIATLARSQLAGIGVGIGVYFGEQFASIFLPDVVKYLPFNAATAVVEVSGDRGGGGGAIISPLDPNLALLIVAGWLIGALIVTSLFTERAEISG